MKRRQWFVQERGDDGLFRTIENGTHANLSTAYAQYVAQDEGVHQLLRNDVIVLRSDSQVSDRSDIDALF